MDIIFDQSGNTGSFIRHLNQLSATPEVNGIMVLGCAGNKFDEDKINEALKQINIPVFGGLFPSIIYQKKKYDAGTIFCSFSQHPEVTIIENISDESLNFDAILEPDYANHSRNNTMFIFVDGYAWRMNPFFESLYDILGLEFDFIGAAAGSLEKIQKPMIITNRGLRLDTAILTSMNLKNSIGVGHGWKEIAGPFLITNASHNTIKTIDLEPAYKIYKQAIEEHSGQLVTRENFKELTNLYPFGITRLDADIIVREPHILEDDDSLKCICGIPQGTYIHILHGEKSDLLNAVEEARKLCADNYLGTDGELLLIIDCISRFLFMEEDFQYELNALAMDSVPMIGALSLGEIANSGDGFLEFYNKTAVLGLLGD